VFKKGRSGKPEDGFTSIEEAVRERPALEKLLNRGTPKVQNLRLGPGYAS